MQTNTKCFLFDQMIEWHIFITNWAISFYLLCFVYRLPWNSINEWGKGRRDGICTNEQISSVFFISVSIETNIRTNFTKLLPSAKIFLLLNCFYFNFKSNMANNWNIETGIQLPLLPSLLFFLYLSSCCLMLLFVCAFFFYCGRNYYYFTLSTNKISICRFFDEWN